MFRCFEDRPAEAAAVGLLQIQTLGKTVVPRRRPKRKDTVRQILVLLHPGVDDVGFYRGSGIRLCQLAISRTEIHDSAVARADPGFVRHGSNQRYGGGNATAVLRGRHDRGSETGRALPVLAEPGPFKSSPEAVLWNHVFGVREWNRLRRCPAPRRDL